jgi:hypothetical protein
MSGGKKMSRIRTAAVLVILAVIVTGISMANKPNVGEEDSITVSPSMLVLSRYVAAVTVHTNIRGSMARSNVWLYRAIDDEDNIVYINPVLVKTDSLGYLVAKFNAEQVKDIVEPGKIELTLETIDGFIASDKIQVKK